MLMSFSLSVCVCVCLYVCEVIVCLYTASVFPSLGLLCLEFDIDLI